jgi:hypothetical protein
MEQKFNVPAAVVLELLTNAKWLEARCLAMGELSASVKAKKKAGQIHVTMKRRLRRDLPGVLAKVLSPESDLVMEEVWTLEEGGEASGTMDVEIVGQPVRLNADFELLQSGKGCIYRITHRAKASVRLVGGTIERFATKQTEEACALELKYLADYLKKA